MRIRNTAYIEMSPIFLIFSYILTFRHLFYSETFSKGTFVPEVLNMYVCMFKRQSFWWRRSEIGTEIKRCLVYALGPL
jgi:hypothetical protein